jgi:rod shape-determining protein MreC
MRLVWWMATVLAVGLISIVLSERGGLAPLDEVTLTISAPVENVLYDAASPIDDIYSSIKDHGHLVRENDELRARIEEMESQLAEQQSNQQTITNLEAALGVKSRRPEDQLLAAHVLALDVSAQKRMIAIDRGSSDGVSEGMVIMSGAGSLVGTVVSVYEGYAWVRLITDADSTVNAQVNSGVEQPRPAPTPAVITGGDSSPTPAPTASPAPTGEPQPTAVRGVIKGDLRVDVVLDLLPPDASIAKGDLVVTSGLGGNYPPGILIGIISSVQQRPESALTQASVEPAAKLGSLDTVLVLLNFKPARLEAP